MSAPDDRAAVVTVPALLTVATVAELLDSSPRTVRRRIAAGELPAVTDHGRVMVRGDELRAYVEGLEGLGALTFAGGLLLSVSPFAVELIFHLGVSQQPAQPGHSAPPSDSFRIAPIAPASRCQFSVSLPSAARPLRVRR